MTHYTWPSCAWYIYLQDGVVIKYSSLHSIEKSFYAPAANATYFRMEVKMWCMKITTFLTEVDFEWKFPSREYQVPWVLRCNTNEVSEILIESHDWNNLLKWRSIPRKSGINTWSKLFGAHTEPNPGGARLLLAKADVLHASCHIPKFISAWGCVSLARLWAPKYWCTIN